MTKRNNPRKRHAILVAEDRMARELAEACRQCDKRPEVNKNTGKRYRMCKKHRMVDCERKKAEYQKKKANKDRRRRKRSKR